MSGEDNHEKFEEHRKVARKVEELPDLPQGWVRVVHIANPEKEEDLLKTGLNYIGAAMSTAVAWSKPEEVEVWTNDPKFNFPGAKALVLDMPAEEWRQHNDVARSPENISANRIVGWVDAKKPTI